MSRKATGHCLSLSIYIGYDIYIPPKPLDIKGYRVSGKKHNLWRYVGKITVNPRLNRLRF